MSGLFSLELEKYFCSYSNDIYRIVEGQHFIATRKLVDNDDEQQILEDILDASKPPAPTHNARGALHYLLYTPFRYPPLKSGGRFHLRTEQSIFYGAEDLNTAMAEAAYGRFLFLHHTQAQFEPMQVPYTHFVVRVQSDAALKLHETPFHAYTPEISSPVSYRHSQALGARMRSLGTTLFVYPSARKPSGLNVGLFTPEVFLHNKPLRGRDGHWSVFISAETVEFNRAQPSHVHRETHTFAFADFCDSGHLCRAV